MQFQVPQFIELEDKIVGPLTLKQFFFVAGAGFSSFLLFFVFQTWLWLIFTAVLGTLGVSFAFIKFNGRSMLITILAALKYFWQPRFYLWHKELAIQELPTIPDIKLVRQQRQEEKPLEGLWQKIHTTTQPIKNREKFSLNLFQKVAEPIEQFEVQRKTTGDRRVYKRIDYR